ncbi:unnamed protein product [Umbelopsis ramanniana]
MTTQDTLRTLLENLEAFKPTIIPSPKHQPRRACVSIIIRWNGHEHSYKDKEPMATTWRQFLDKPWVKNNKNGGPELLFMQRATRTGDRWSGHVAFPGGKNEKDETDVETVVRETWEEVGLDLNAEDFIPVGRLDDREITSAQDGKLIMMLSPFVYLQVSPQTPTLKLQTSEVASVHWIPLQFFLSVEPYSYRPMKIKLMSKMPPHLRSLAPVAQGLFGNMEVPAIDLPDGNPSSPPRLWGLTLGMTSQLINMTVGSSSGRPIRSRNEKRLAFVDLESSPPKYSFPDIAALVWMFFKMGIAWQNIRGVRTRSKSSRTTSWAEDADLPLYYAALRKSLTVAGILRVAGVMIIILKAYKLLKYRRGVMA